MSRMISGIDIAKVEKLMGSDFCILLYELASQFVCVLCSPIDLHLSFNQHLEGLFHRQVRCVQRNWNPFPLPFVGIFGVLVRSKPNRGGVEVFCGNCSPLAIIAGGGVGERLKPAVLKTVRPERVSGVRIPPPPPCSFVFVLRVLVHRRGAACATPYRRPTSDAEICSSAILILGSESFVRRARPTGLSRSFAALSSLAWTDE